MSSSDVIGHAFDAVFGMLAIRLERGPAKKR
jgi:hypothetical protein